MKREIESDDCDDLVRLPNGGWVDPCRVIEISVVGPYDSPIAKHSHGPQVCVHIGGHCQVLDFDRIQDAQAWADQFAANHRNREALDGKAAL